MADNVRVLFDEAHGQAHWEQTGFPSRQASTRFSGVAQHIQALGYECGSHAKGPMGPALRSATLLVIPPPVGIYRHSSHSWVRLRDSLYSPDQICDILRFLRRGGRLLAFAYRFGDTFTQSNLRDLFTPLGCILNDDAIVDISNIKNTHALTSEFVATLSGLPPTNLSPERFVVTCRSAASFTLLPWMSVAPLLVSPGGRCISFDRTHKTVSFQRKPIAIAGNYGEGRFVLFGGPHLFETGSLGLLSNLRNAAFLDLVLEWLLSNGDGEPTRLTGQHAFDAGLSLEIDEHWKQFCQVGCKGRGEPLVRTVERCLQRSGFLYATSADSRNAPRFKTDRPH